MQLGFAGIKVILFKMILIIRVNERMPTEHDPNFTKWKVYVGSGVKRIMNPYHWQKSTVRQL